MSDKRSVATDALETLGTIIDETAKRDAIHLAVIPAIAGNFLHPGQHVEIDGEHAVGTAEGKGLGIVDPFLITQVSPGQRFWLVIYPRTIKSLRHVWSHPAFADEPGASDPTPQSERAAGQIGASKAESERWLRDFCDRSDVPSFERVIEAISDSDDLEYGLTISGDASGEIPEEFWLHVEILLGRKIKHHPTYFSCSC